MRAYSLMNFIYQASSWPYNTENPKWETVPQNDTYHLLKFKTLRVMEFYKCMYKEWFLMDRKCTK